MLTALVCTKESLVMDLHQKVHELRTRIERLRAQLDTDTNLEPTSQAVQEPEPAQPKQPSAADAYKARLMGKQSS